MAGKIINYACNKFKFMVGELDITSCVTSFGVAQSKFEVGKPLIWSGSMGLVQPVAPYNISESLDNLENPYRWAKGRYPVKVFLFGCQFLTLRISSYSYDPDTKEAEAQLTDLLGLMDFEHDPKDTEVQTENSFDQQGNFAQTKAPWPKVAAHNLVRGSRVKNQEYIKAAQLSFPANLETRAGKIPSYSVAPPIASNPVQQVSQISMAAGGWVPWVDALENIRFCKYPLGEIAPVYELSREEVDEFKRGEPEEDEITSMAVIASGTHIKTPEPRTLEAGSMASKTGFLPPGGY